MGSAQLAYVDTRAPVGTAMLTNLDDRPGGSSDKLKASDEKIPFGILMQQPRCSKIEMHSPDGIARTPSKPGGAVN